MLGRRSSRYRIFTPCDPRHIGFQFRLFDEGARSEDGAYLGCGAGILHAARARLVIQHGGHAALRAGADHHAHRGGEVGHQDADAFIRLAVFGDETPQRQRHLEQIAVGIFDLLHVFQHAAVAAIDVHRIQQAGIQRLLRMRFEQHFLHQLAHRIARLAAALFGGLAFRHGDDSGGQRGDGDAREHAARILAGDAAEIGACRTIQTHRQDGGAGFGCDECRAFIHLHQRTGHGDAAFGEDHHRTPGLDQFDDFLDRHRAGRIDREIVDLAQDQAEEEVARDARMHHKYRIERQEQPQQQAIQKRFMVGDDQQLAGIDVLIHPSGTNAEQQLKDIFQNKSDDASHFENSHFFQFSTRLTGITVKHDAHSAIPQQTCRCNRLALPWNVAKIPHLPESLIGLRIALQQRREILNFAQLHSRRLIQHFAHIARAELTFRMQIEPGVIQDAVPFSHGHFELVLLLRIKRNWQAGHRDPPLVGTLHKFRPACFAGKRHPAFRDHGFFAGYVGHDADMVGPARCRVRYFGEWWLGNADEHHIARLRVSCPTH